MSELEGATPPLPDLNDAFSQDEIDETVVLLMEQSGCGNRDNGWEFREQLSYARETEQIIRQLLAREFAATTPATQAAEED